MFWWAFGHGVSLILLLIPNLRLSGLRRPTMIIVTLSPPYGREQLPRIEQGYSVRRIEFSKSKPSRFCMKT